jgi:hypothetical protein
MNGHTLFAATEAAEGLLGAYSKSRSLFTAEGEFVTTRDGEKVRMKVPEYG